MHNLGGGGGGGGGGGLEGDQLQTFLEKKALRKGASKLS